MSDTIGSTEEIETTLEVLARLWEQRDDASRLRAAISVVREELDDAWWESEWRP